MNATYFVKILSEISDIMDENRDRLIELDSVAGDGDLGLTMTKGFRAGYDKVKDSGESDAGRLLYAAGKAMSSAAPSTMGTLMAIGLMQAGKVLKGKTELEPADLVAFLSAYEEGIMVKGKAKLGEKTFLDGFDPGLQAVKNAVEAGEELKEATLKGALAAKEGYQAAKMMRAVHGKPAVKGDSSIGMEDPGACVAMLIYEAIAKASS